MIAIAAIGALGGLCQWLAWRFNLPSILFLLTAGILVGPIFGLLEPDRLLGDLLFPIVSIFVAIILFEGGLTLKFKDIKGHGLVVQLLITVGVLLTGLLIAISVHFLFGMSWSLSFVFGSITVVSGPTVVKPLLRAVRPSDRVGHILHWEGILIDPIGVFLALVVFNVVMIQTTDSSYVEVAILLVKLVVIGSVVGLAAGAGTALVLRRYLVPDYLVNVLSLVVVVCAFVLAETLQHESGLLAVTLMGVWLANTRGLHVDEILHFKEDLSVLLISALFILLASRVDIALIPEYGWQILLLLVIIQLVIRPLNAWLCTIGSELSHSERAFIGWISPRGIVAAAVSSVFALRLQELDLPMIDLFVPLIFSVIIGTVVFQSLTARRVADTLGISNPEPNGVLFIGINDIAMKLATALKKHDIPVMLSDSSWQSVRQARQAGFEAYHGNATSGHAVENLNLQGIGKMAAVSANRDTNALAGMHFRQEFGNSAVFTLEGMSDDEMYERFDTANRNRANPLFDNSLSYSALSRRLRNGKIRHLSIPDQADEVVTPARNQKASENEQTESDAQEGDKPEQTRSESSDLHRDTDRTALSGSPTDESAQVRNEADSELPQVTENAQGDSQSKEVPAGSGATNGDRQDDSAVVSDSDSDSKDGLKETDGQDKSADDKATRLIETVDDAVSTAVDGMAHPEEEEEKPQTHDAEKGSTELYSDADLKLFAIDKDGKLYIYGAGERITLKPGWTLVVLSPED